MPLIELPFTVTTAGVTPAAGIVSAVVAVYPSVTELPPTSPLGSLPARIQVMRRPPLVQLLMSPTATVLGAATADGTTFSNAAGAQASATTSCNGDRLSVFPAVIATDIGTPPTTSVLGVIDCCTVGSGSTIVQGAVAFTVVLFAIDPCWAYHMNPTEFDTVVPALLVATSVALAWKVTVAVCSDVVPLCHPLVAVEKLRIQPFAGCESCGTDPSDVVTAAEFAT